MIDALYGWFDNRLGASKGGRSVINKIFPDHWSFLLGEIALYSFIVLVATGIFLTLYFIPSGHDTVCHVPYKPVDGTVTSQAYCSTLQLSFTVRFGLVMRQMHHWAANIFVGAIVVHMLRIFFTGGFRRPRELNWMIGATLLILAIFNGFLGYSVPDDLVSGTGIRIAYSILLSVPLVGSYLATFLFGGVFGQSTIIIPRFYILHVLILPLIIIALITAHIGLLTYQKHTQFRGRGATENNVIGSPLFPTFTAKTTGFFFMIAGISALLGGLVQINPIWQYGPYVPYKVTYAVQPDWYMGWLDGALRIFPPWEPVAAGHMIPTVFFPAILLPGVTFTLIYLYPLIEARITKDYEAHNLLDRPRDRPKRTALGAAVLSFYLVLFGASATDVLAHYLFLTLGAVLWAFRILVFVVPAIVYPVTYKICRELQETPGSGKRKRANVVLRSAAGGYSAVPSETRPGDEELDLEPVPVDEELIPAGALAANGHDEAGDGHGPGREGVLEPALAGGGHAGSTADGDGDGVAQEASPVGERVFKIPRYYR
jgi:ubiquinol-cytochrome c reductase cytochrome b subunit